MHGKESYTTVSIFSLAIYPLLLKMEDAAAR
jgi:hypothetical protein